MSGAFADALAALHADTNLGTDAEYQAPGGSSWTAIRVVLATPSPQLGAAFGVGARATRREAWIKAADVTPLRGGSLRIAGAVYRIESPEADEMRLTWRCELAA